MIETILDPSIKYWVLLPISFVMVVVGILRQDILTLLGPDMKALPNRKTTELQYINKANMLISNGGSISRYHYEQRQARISIDFVQGKFLAETPKEGKPENPLGDPASTDALMAMGKQQIANYVPQTLIMAWVNYFFPGFVLMKLPFPLTVRFKEMLQSGVATADLDVRWVSAISWYFISMLGMNPVNSLLLGDESVDVLAQQQMAQQQQMSMPGGPKSSEIMKQLANDVKIMTHHDLLKDVEKRILEKYAC